jgi:adenine phosphoribosyltransferase
MTDLQQRLNETFRWVNGHADVWRFFDDAELFGLIVDALIQPFRGDRITKVAGVESRGFILGGAAAIRLGAGFVAVRKVDGLFPGDKLTTQAGPDYRGNAHVLRLQKRSLVADDRVLVVDDWCETGNQALGARQLIENAGAEFVGLACIVDQAPQELSKRLGRYHTLIKPPPGA